VISAARHVPLRRSAPNSDMIKLKIDNKDITAEPGMTVLDAASLAGVTIPALCYNKETGHFTSCMVCMVMDVERDQLIPSCSALVREGMDLSTTDPQVSEARKMSLELLLSEHVGDCEAPCRTACPAYMDIPLMNTYLAGGMPGKALETVRKDIAFPSVLGRICPAPCEGACRRKGMDGAVSVCLLKRFAGDEGIEKEIPVRALAENGKSVAVIGAGIAGLSAAWYLQIKGYRCTVFDKNPLAGGALRYAIDDQTLDKKVLDREINYILDSGVGFFPGTEISAESFNKLRREYDAVVLASGDFKEDMKGWGLDNNGKQLTIDKSTYQTNIPEVFAIGNVNRSIKLAIRSAAQGKEVAHSIEQFLDGRKITGEYRAFNSRFGRLNSEEYETYIQEAAREKRLEPAGGISLGYSSDEVRTEAARCMHCECLKPLDCKLRILSGQYGASQKRFSYEERRNIVKQWQHELVVYEKGKCIKCGICVRLSGKHGEELGLTYIGRGFDVEIAVPFGEGLNNGLKSTAVMVAEACPTGALALRNINGKNPGAK
jgi:hypothetical protein